jgi:uncharacterized Fe-S cluster-containing protein
VNTSIGVSNMNNSRHNWAPPGKDCGLCGCRTCEIFLILVNTGDKKFSDCPFYCKQSGTVDGIEQEAQFPKKDVLGTDYDFILHPLPGEISARKIVLPFRSDQVDKMKIAPGDIVLGRPMGAGCPIPHVLKVIEADPVTGLLYTWVVGPKYSRGKKVKDVVAYHMIGFEGIARNIKREPQFGKRHSFLPGFCMMSINHTGLVNMVLTKKAGLHIRIENIIIIN